PRRGRYGGDATDPDWLRAFLPAARSARYGRRAGPAHRHGRARRLRAALEGAGSLAVGGRDQLPHARVQQQRHRVLLARRLLVDGREHLSAVDQADEVVPAALVHRRRPAAVQLRRRSERPPGTAVRSDPDLELLEHQRLLDSPAQRLRRPVDARRTAGAGPGERLLLAQRQYGLSQNGGWSVQRELRLQ